MHFMFEFLIYVENEPIEKRGSIVNAFTNMNVHDDDWTGLKTGITVCK